MITFFVRLGILFLALITIGFVGGLNFPSFSIACIFVCAWISVVPTDKILWWLVAFAIIFGLINYDVFGFYTISIICVIFLFEIIYKYIVSTANDGFIILFITSFILALFFVFIIDLIQHQNVFINIQTIGIGLVISTIFFWFFRFIIKYAQKFINLYTHGTDMRCHT